MAVSRSVVIIPVRLGTAAGLSMVLRAVMRRREVMVKIMVVVKIIVVVVVKVMLVVMVKVIVVGQRRAKRVKCLMRTLSQLKAEAEGEWKSKGWDWSLGYRGRWGEARTKGDTDKI